MRPRAPALVLTGLALSLGLTGADGQSRMRGPVDADVRRERHPFGPGAVESTLDAIFVHRGAGRVVRPDMREGSRIAPHRLSFALTPEDAARAPADAPGLFADSPHARAPLRRGGP